MTTVGVDSPRTSLVDWSWLALPYAILLVTAVLALSEHPPPATLGWMLILIFVFCGWHWWWAIHRRHQLGVRLLPMATYFLAVVATTVMLCLVSFAFFPLYVVTFATAFVALPGAWAYVGVVITAAVPFAVPWLLDFSFANITAIIGGGAMASAAGWSIRALERSQTRLQAALGANLALQERLVDGARDAGIAAERTRLAAEFHDTVAAGLSGVVMQLEAIDARIEPNHPVRPRLQKTMGVARDSLREARRSVADLRPTELNGRTLVSAIAATTTEFESNHQIPVVFTTTGREYQTGHDVKHTVLRAASEALTNVARHADASAVHVTLTYFDGEVTLDVTDDGRGLPRDPTDRGHGLELMRHRVGELGGRVTLARGTPRGTTVTVRIPTGQVPRDE